MPGKKGTSLMELKEKHGILSTLMAILRSITSTVRSIVFAYIYPIVLKLFYTHQADQFRKEVFSNLKTVVPFDKNEGLLRILEIGSGPGCNFDYFPTACRYVAVEKNSNFKNVLLQTLAKYPGIQLDNFINGCGENMSSISSNSIDIVITSHLHCSADDSDKILKEIKRILIPGGRYYFFEHVLDESDTLRYKWQLFFNKIGLWQLLGNGCTFVNFEKQISQAGFLKYHGKRYVFPNNSLGYYPMYLIASHFGGYAEKGK